MQLPGNLKKLLGCGCVLLLCTSLGFARSGKSKSPHQSHSKTKVTASHGKGKGSRLSAKKNKGPRGQQTIQSERATEIQEALIREHYLQGEPSGTWDQRSKEAMTRYQSDNGWQSKVVPDSRALIKLGLGPKQAGLINPDTAVRSPLADTGAARGDMRGDAQR